MNTADSERKSSLFDVEGYLVDPEDWNRDIALDLAAEEALNLNDEYWQILEFIRQYWSLNRVSPDVRHVVGYLVEHHEFDKKEAKRHLFDLFPYGYVKQACRIAGMRRPRAWSTG